MITKSDKILHHGYHRYYRNFFACVPPNPTVLEIGVDNGNSLDLWSHYFDEPKMYAIDIDEKTVPEAVSFARVDQSSRPSLRAYAADKVSLFDVIIDDGSHIPQHQVLTINILWECLKPGGVYVIEDIETCYWKRSELYGYNFDARNKQTNVIEIIKSSIDVVNGEFSFTKAGKPSAIECVTDFDMVLSGTNVVCIIKKDSDKYGEYYDRKYRGLSAIDANSPLRKLRRFIKRTILDRS